MRSRLDDVDAAGAVRRALTRGVCGVGGRLDTPPASLDAAVLAVRQAHGDRAARRLDRFAREPDGAFVWTRDEVGYAVGRLAGAWLFDGSPEAFALDLVHVRATVWAPRRLTAHEAPGQVVTAFARGGRNLQRVAAAGATEVTWEAWRQAGGEPGS
ncbi:GAF domain-containing protein [Cellulomonas sp. APG4]|nr:GAF domain-containing protein [Cellulomonas sp. APG4]NCT91710.1 GAF domain-containing protein [Cellulomonas sp. APG4]